MKLILFSRTMYPSTVRKYINVEYRQAEIWSNLLCVFADCTGQHCSDSSEAPNPTQSFLSTRERGKGGFIWLNMVQSNQRGWSLTRKMDSNQIDAQSPVIVAHCGFDTQDDDTAVKRAFEGFNWLSLCIITHFLLLLFFIGKLHRKFSLEGRLLSVYFQWKALNKMYEPSGWLSRQQINQSGHPAGTQTQTVLINPDASLVCYLRKAIHYSPLHRRQTDG